MKQTRRFARVLWDAFNGFNGSNDGWSMAGFIAFSGLLSLFPFLIFAATLIGIMVGHERSDEIIDALFRIAPPHVALTLEPVVVEVLGKQSREVLTISAIFAVWVASNAVEAFRIAFDRAYQVDDPRNFFQNRALAISLVFLGAVVSALLGVSILLSPLIITYADSLIAAPIPPIAGFITYGLGLGVLMGFITVMHRTLPGRSMRGTRIWPGVLVTSVIWVIAATAFSTYLSFTPSYTIIYGTLAGVIITLMFFYITGATIIFGAEVNASLDRLVRTENAHMMASMELGAPWRSD